MRNQQSFLLGNNPPAHTTVKTPRISRFQVLESAARPAYFPVLSSFSQSLGDSSHPFRSPVPWKFKFSYRPPLLYNYLLGRESRNQASHLLKMESFADVPASLAMTNRALSSIKVPHRCLQPFPLLVPLLRHDLGSFSEGHALFSSRRVSHFGRSMSSGKGNAGAGNRSYKRGWGLEHGSSLGTWYRTRMHMTLPIVTYFPVHGLIVVIAFIVVIIILFI
ncbi:hypothetical protein K458DRAFT_405566 [Lentithecium fluviatile CBS 122367]|uniref:Uncharacterized protein n=1 Tax=Lentithecium fluviatile CBS 122367 TaxID=1168545 RepID=A0A6G1IXZ1_9PLEO|nr:hypothetical protein K458DRAFT_405566 [Lentithecium fluviatile CBS 122367]